MEQTKFLVIGGGAIGRRHIANLRLLEPNAHITLLHQHTQPGDAAAHPPQVNRVVYSMDEALAELPVAALINSPASRHIETALQLADRGIHLFVEKPISNTLNGIDELLLKCQQHSLSLMVAYPFRFYKPLQIAHQLIGMGRIGRVLSIRIEAGQYLPDWRPGRDYRESVSARSALGGGAVLELSHELDTLRWLCGEVTSVTALCGKLSDLEIDVEDVAEAILQMQSGAIASVHVDMVQRAAFRGCRVVGTQGTLCWDAGVNSVKLYSAENGLWEDLVPAHACDRNEMYVEELRHFLACARGEAQPVTNPRDARRVLEIALAIKASSQTGGTVKL